MSTATETAKAMTNGQPPEPQRLAAKLVAAALEVENVPKAGKNAQQNYNYAKAEDVVAAATKALLARGVHADLETIDSVAHPIKSRQGADGLIVTVRCRLIVTDSETGEILTRPAMGAGSDYPGDKAIYKAMTGARKYAFMHLLDIPIGDDPDAHHPEANARRAKAPELDSKRVEAIRDAMKAKGYGWDKVELMLGSAGANAPKARRKDSLLKALREMTPEQATALEGLIAADA